MEIVNNLWNEKYRPKTIDEVVLPERYMKDFKRMIERQELVSVIMSGPPGGGKTTLARILCSKNGVIQNPRDNVLEVNGSAQESRGIGFVDKVIVPFLRVPPAGDKFRVVFIDEADNLTPDSYRSLRGIIEKAQAEYGRFIFTCNYPSKIPDPLQSRFTHYKFQQIPKEFVHDYIANILKSEDIKFIEKDVRFVIETLYPDVRKIVNTVQQCSWNGTLEVDQEKVKSVEKIILSNIVEIVGFIASSDNLKIGRAVNIIVEILKDQEVDYRSMYDQLFFMEKFPAPAKIVVNKYANRHQGSLIPHQHFLAMVYEIIVNLTNYKRLRNGS